MKKIFLVFLVAAFAFSLSSCRETKSEKVKDDVEDVADDVGDAIDDAGDAVEDVVDDN